MTANQSRLLGVALLLAAISGVMALGRGRDAADDPADREAVRQALLKKLQAEQEVERARARLENGAFVLRSKRLSDTEEIATIVIPEGHSSELDTRCVVYKNAELKSSSITCAGAMFRPSTP